MKTYTYDSNYKITENSFDSVPLADSSEVKVRILKAGLTSRDLKIASLHKESALSPSSCAVGVVSEVVEGSGYSRGEKVILSPYLPITAKSTDDEKKVKRGENITGFLTDFININSACLTPLTSSVTDEEALFVPYIALGLKAIEQLNLKKGSFVYVGSGGLLSNIICNLILYYQSIPILFGSKNAELELAKKTGIYYTAQTTSRETKQYVRQITSGRNANYAIICDSGECSLSDLAQLLSYGSVISLARMTEMSGNVSISDIYDNNFTVFTVNTAPKYIIKALNLLATKSIDVKPLIRKTANINDVNNLINDMKECDKNKMPVLMNIVDL